MALTAGITLCHNKGSQFCHIKSLSMKRIVECLYGSVYYTRKNFVKWKWCFEIVLELLKKLVEFYGRSSEELDYIY